MDAISWQGIENVAVVCGAIFFAYLGYRLYMLGVVKSKVSANADVTFGKIAINGGGPGLGFMFMGGVVLLATCFGEPAVVKTESLDDDGKRSSVSALSTASDGSVDELSLLMGRYASTRDSLRELEQLPDDVKSSKATADLIAKLQDRLEVLKRDALNLEPTINPDVFRP
jgi:hypothetical protein